MTDFIRSQVYRRDMGLLRKAYIVHLSKEDFNQLNASEYTKAIELTEGDWYGSKLPDVIRDEKGGWPAPDASQ